MILYFSGTGNSEYAARRISTETKDKLMNLGERIRSRDFSGIHSDTPWVVAAPTYAWRIPRVLEEWLKNTELRGNKNIYFVMTCGGNIGNAGRYLKKLARSKGLDYRGCAQIVMPENYIAMFTTPTREEAAGIILKSHSAIDKAALKIKQNEPFPQLPITRKDKINSSIVNILFYPMFVHAKKFQATNACTSCGKCAVICPLNNIHLKNGTPVWGKNCTHCMACINRCPTQAKLRIDMRSEIKRLHHELGTTIIYVTHDQVEALTMSTKIAIFFEGELEQVAPPMEIYQNPISLRVADFIGNPKSNFVEGKAVREPSGQVRVNSDLGEMVFSPELFTEDMPESGEFDCVIGIRPEKVQVHRDPGPGRIEGHVYSVQSAGSDTTVQVNAGQSALLSKEIGIQFYNMDQKVYISVNPDKVNLFHKGTGRLIRKAVLDQ